MKRRRTLAIALYDHLADTAGLPANPARLSTLPPGQHAQGTGLTSAEYDAVERAVFADHGPPSARLKGPMLLRNRLAMALMLDHGLRPVQLVRATHHDLRPLDEGLGLWTGAKRGGKILLLTPRVVGLLDAAGHIRRHSTRTPIPRRQPILTTQAGNALNRRALYMLCTRAGRKAGLTRPLAPITLRRTHAGRLKRAGFDMLAIRDALCQTTLHNTERYLGDDVSTAAHTLWLSTHPAAWKMRTP